MLRGHTGRVADLDWSADNSFLLSCGRDGDLRLWHADSGALVRRFEQGADLWGCPLACCRWVHSSMLCSFASVLLSCTQKQRLHKSSAGAICYT